MDILRDFGRRLKDLAATPLLGAGSSSVSLGVLLSFGVQIVALLWLSAKLRRWLAARLRRGGNVGASEATAAMVRYAVVALGFLIILQTAGIDLTGFTVLAGSIGIGVGFGLQNIVNNFVSGLIILFERPIKVGDRIEVDGIEGEVREINPRSTTVVTNDNIAIILPNSKFVTETVINWSHNDEVVRFPIPVKVAYASHVRQVERVLLDVARTNGDVLAEPAPNVRFVRFGDSALEFELRVWSTSLIHRKGLLVSALNFAILEALQENGIAVPFPQRELYLRGGTIDVRNLPASGGETRRPE